MGKTAGFVRQQKTDPGGTQVGEGGAAGTAANGVQMCFAHGGQISEFFDHDGCLPMENGQNSFKSLYL